MFTSTPPSFLSLWFFLFWEGMTNDLSSYGINRQKLCVVSKVMSNILPLLLLYFINDQSCSYFFYYTPVYLLIFCTDIFISRYIYIFEYTHFATFCTFNMLHISALNSLCFYNMFFRLINSKWRRETSCSFYLRKKRQHLWRNGVSYSTTDPKIHAGHCMTKWSNCSFPERKVEGSISGRNGHIG